MSGVVSIVGERIRAQRRAQGLSSNELAEILDIEIEELNAIERGRPLEHSMALQVALALDIPVKELTSQGVEAENSDVLFGISQAVKAVL